MKNNLLSDNITNIVKDDTVSEYTKYDENGLIVEKYKRNDDGILVKLAQEEVDKLNNTKLANKSITRKIDNFVSFAVDKDNILENKIAEAEHMLNLLKSGDYKDYVTDSEDYDYDYDD